MIPDAECTGTPSQTSNGQVCGEPPTLAAIRVALEVAGVEFIAENSGGPGVRLRKQK
jgi:hypothetical protein